MSPHTHTPSADWSIEDLYNFLMEDIEPDLTTTMFAFLDEIYAGESSGERATRGAYYAQAMETCFQRMDTMLHLCKENVSAFKVDILQRLKAKELDTPHS